MVATLERAVQGEPDRVSDANELRTRSPSVTPHHCRSSLPIQSVLAARADEHPEEDGYDMGTENGRGLVRHGFPSRVGRALAWGTRQIQERYQQRETGLQSRPTN